MSIIRIANGEQIRNNNKVERGNNHENSQCGSKHYGNGAAHRSD